MPSLARLTLATAGLLLILIVGMVAYARQSEPGSPGLAFLSTTDGQRGYFVHFVSKNRRAIRQLSEIRAEFGDVAWSPDGRWVIYSSGDVDQHTAIYRTTISSQRTEQLTSEDGYASQPVLSPDGAFIAYQHQGNGEATHIYRISVNGDDAEQLTRDTNQGYSPRWSPDGEWIAFAKHVSGDSFQLYRMRADGSDRQSLSFAYHSGLGWSPDSRYLTFTVRVNYSGDFEIYRADIQADEVDRLTGGSGVNVMPSWSPDGQWIAFVSSRDGNRQIYRMRADGSRQTRLTDDYFENIAPAWSPDGQWIAYASQQNGQHDLMVMRADGSQQRHLTRSQADEMRPIWSPVINLRWNGLVLMLAGLFLTGTSFMRRPAWAVWSSKKFAHVTRASS